MLKKFGQVVLDYFLINYPNTYSFKLSVDDYTFSEFTTLSGFEEEKVIRAIQKKGTFCCNDLEALAIAVYQVKIVGDVESIQSSGSDSYYQKIRDNYFSFKDSDNNTICNKYFSNQITLWRTVRDLFNKHGRNLEIPEDHPYSGRYVQYPVKSHELKNSELLDWANNFINKLSEFNERNKDAILSVLEKNVFIINKSFSFSTSVYHLYNTFINSGIDVNIWIITLE